MRIRHTDRTLHLSLAWLVLLLALLVMPRAARATSDLFHFEAEANGQGYVIELVGHEDPGGIVQFYWSGSKTGDGPSTLPFKSYETKVDFKKKRLTIRYTNPDDVTLPPSFVLTVKDNTGKLVESGGHTFHGRADWGPF